MSKLAINGGSPVFKKKNIWPVYGKREPEALKNVLESGKWGIGGKEGERFEKRFAEYQQSKHGLAVTNGTVSLEIILRAMDIGYGDEVIVPTYTFVATASSVMSVGAVPVFADIERDTYNIDACKVEEAITERTKAVIPVHIGGHMCDMDRIMDIAEKYNLYVIEDAAHSHGSEWKGRRAGSIGHAGSFSFQSSKNLTSGEGGFITVNDDSLYEKCWSVKNCGRSLTGEWYEHFNIGTNARMSEWQSAILNIQIDKLDGEIEQRSKNAEYLKKRLKEIKCIEIRENDERVTRNSYHLFVIRFLGDVCKGLGKKRFLDALRAEGVEAGEGYKPLHTQPVFTSSYFKKTTGRYFDYPKLVLENAERAFSKEGIWLHHSYLLGDYRDMDNIVQAVNKVCSNPDELINP